ncbi:dehydrase and lipid transport-domain-containing protein [Pyronema omphalodes]|nr:dehydrase and lipid transport-domain-containing protein [Pyronema omphalodes]
MILPRPQPFRACARPLQAYNTRRNFLPLPFSSPTSTSSSSSSPSFPSPFAPSGSNSITARLHLPYSPQSVYHIILDIPRYSNFLPFCVNSTVASRDSISKLPTSADLTIGWGSFHETFRSEVKCIPEQLVVETQAHEDMFTVLKGRWEVAAGGRGGASIGEREVELDMDEAADGEGCTVNLRVEYGFKNGVYQVVAPKVMEAVGEELVRGFAGRVEKVLGTEAEREEIRQETGVVAFWICGFDV